MSKADKIILQLKAENKDLKAKLKESEKGTKKFSESVKKVGKNMALAAVVGAVALVAGLKKLITITDKQVRAERQLNAVLKSTKNASGLTANEVKRMAAEFQKVTRFGDETILTATNMLLTFTKIGKEVFPQATETVLNMAEAMGTDLKTQAIQVGKALNDPILGVTALRRVGVQLSETQTKQIKDFVKLGDVASAQKVILGELETQFGGVARAVAKSAGGAFEQLGNKIGDVAEGVGKDLTPDLLELAGVFSEASDDGGLLFDALNAIGTAAGFVIRQITSLVRTMDSAVKRANKYNTSLARNKRDLDTLENTLIVVNKLLGEGNTHNALGTDLLELKAETIKKIRALEKSNTAITDKSTEALKKNNKAKKEGSKHITKAKGKVADPASLAKFLGQDQLAEELVLEKQRIEMVKNFKDQEVRINEQAAKKKKEIDEKYNAFTMQNGLSILGSTTSLLGQLGQLENMALSNKLGNLDIERDARAQEIEATITNEDDRKTALSLLDEKFNRKKRNEQRKSAKMQKKIAIAETLMSIPQAAFAAYKALVGIPIVGPALATAAASATTLLGLKKVQLIEEAPLPSFQKGRVPAGEFPAFVGSKEAIIEQRATEANAGLLQAINAGKGETIGMPSTIVVNSIIDGKQVGQTVNDFRQDQEDISTGRNYQNESVF